MKEKSIEFYIYDYIKMRSENETWTSIADIQNYLKEKFSLEVKHRRVKSFVNSIRTNDTIQKVIITDYRKGYKIPLNAIEIAQYLANRKKAIVKMLKNYYKDVRRLKLDNQFKITFGEYERDFIESFIKTEERKQEND